MLRTAILKALRAEGIEVPYSQHDIHLRDLDGVRGALARLGERSAAASAMQDKEEDGLPSATRPEATKR